MNNFGGVGKKLRDWLKVEFKSFFAQEYFQSAIAFWLTVLSLVANLLDWILIKIFIQPIDLSIILHYNVYLGVDMLGNYQRVYFLPLIGLILFGINLSLAIFLYRKKERIASYLLMIATLMIQLSLIVSTVSIIIINY
jgi:hypothetical protein